MKEANLKKFRSAARLAFQQVLITAEDAGLDPLLANREGAEVMESIRKYFNALMDKKCDCG